MDEVSKPNPPNKTNDDNELPSWDDDNFEPPEIAHPVRSIKSGDEGNDAEEEEDWLAPSGRDTGAPSVTSTSIKDQTHSSQYSTKQFERLSTPGSAKKRRCAICTRPISEGNANFCSKHKDVGDDSEGKEACIS